MRDLDNGQGFLMEDGSGTLFGIDGQAPLTKTVPTRRFVERADRLARQHAHKWDMTRYMEELFRWKAVFPPHRYLEPWVNGLKRSLGKDAWHVLDQKEIQGLDTTKADTKSLYEKGYYLNDQEAEDLVVARRNLNLILATGIDYRDRLAAFSIMGGEVSSLFDKAVFKEHEILDTGLEVKWGVGKYIKAHYPDVQLIAREDCRLSAEVLTGVADLVSLVPVKGETYMKTDELQALQMRMPEYLGTDFTKLHYGRLARVLEK